MDTIEIPYNDYYDLLQCKIEYTTLTRDFVYLIKNSYLNCYGEDLEFFNQKINDILKKNLNSIYQKRLEELIYEKNKEENNNGKN